VKTPVREYLVAEVPVMLINMVKAKLGATQGVGFAQHPSGQTPVNSRGLSIYPVDINDKTWLNFSN